MMEEATLPDIEAMLPDLPGAAVTEVPPRYEDSFIGILRGRRIRTARRASNGSAQRLPPQMTESGHAIIEVAQLGRRFGNFRAVKDISFAVARGEVFGLLGANGAGKSTTFRMLCGLLPPSERQPAGCRRRFAACRAAARARIGYMSQKFSLYGHLASWRTCAFSAAPMACRAQRPSSAWTGHWPNST